MDGFINKQQSKRVVHSSAEREIIQLASLYSFEKLQSTLRNNQLMALDYQAEKGKLRSLIGNVTPAIDADINQLIQMLRNEKPLNELYSFIDQKVQAGHRDQVRSNITEAWNTIQHHRSKSTLQREFVNLYSVFTIVSEMFDQQTGKNVIQRLLPLTTRIKPTHSKRVDVLIELMKKADIRKRFNLKQTYEEIAKFIDEKGVSEGINGLLGTICDKQTCNKLIEQISADLKNNVLPRSQKKIRTDPLANIISQLDFYHNYGVELPTDEIAKEMHQHGIRKILKELLLEHFGWKEIDKVQALINTGLENAKSQKSIESVGNEKEVNVPH